MIASNNLMSMYLAIELQSLSLYVAAAIKEIQSHQLSQE